MCIRDRLKAVGNPKRYKNLLGITLGTGFGAGVVIDNCLLTDVYKRQELY